MKEVGYGKGYKYNPNFSGPIGQDYLPSELKNKKYFIEDKVNLKNMENNQQDQKNDKMKIILASGSTTRAEILKESGLDFEALPGDFDERSVKNKDTMQLVKTLALEKARVAAKKYSNAIIIGADTMIDFNGQQIGKGENAAEMKKILMLLRGKTHRIITGLAVINAATNQGKGAVAEAKVTMKNYSDEEIEKYIATGEPIGKAGAYYLRGAHSGMVIDKIEGETGAVSGMPLSVLEKLLGEFGIILPKIK